MTPQLFFFDGSISAKSNSLLAEELPENVELVSIQNHYEENSILVRFEHKTQSSEVEGDAITIQLGKRFADFLIKISNIYFSDDLLNGMTVLTAEEYILSGNLPLKDVNRLEWSSTAEKIENDFHTNDSCQLSSLCIELHPGDLKTFVLTIQ